MIFCHKKWYRYAPLPFFFIILDNPNDTLYCPMNVKCQLSPVLFHRLRRDGSVHILTKLNSGRLWLPQGLPGWSRWDQMKAQGVCFDYWEAANYLIFPSLMMDYSGGEKKKRYSCIFSGDISGDQTESFEFLQSYIQLSNISYFHLFYLVSCFITFPTLILCVCTISKKFEHIHFGSEFIS